MHGLPQFIADYVSSPTGVNNSHDQNQITIYPNPVKNSMFIKDENFQKYFSIILYDITGRNILETRITSSFQEIYLANLASSIYFLEIINNGERIIKKFVKE